MRERNHLWGWTGHGHGHPEMALRGYDDDREATTGPRDEELDEADIGEPDYDAEPNCELMGSGCRDD